jgi:N,N'-diacetylchitobiose phosphorylase
MRYGYFDTEHREYVIDRVDVPVSWTNYIGLRDLCGVLNHTAGGYLFYKSPEYYRISRFKPNGVSMDRFGHYMHIRNDETGEYWSIPWQPVELELDKTAYTCCHGLSYTVYQCEHERIAEVDCVYRGLPDGDESCCG